MRIKRDEQKMQSGWMINGVLTQEAQFRCKSNMQTSQLFVVSTCRTFLMIPAKGIWCTAWTESHESPFAVLQFNRKKFTTKRLFLVLCDVWQHRKSFFSKKCSMCATPQSISHMCTLSMYGSLMAHVWQNKRSATLAPPHFDTNLHLGNPINSPQMTQLLIIVILLETTDTFYDNSTLLSWFLCFWKIIGGNDDYRWLKLH